MHLVLPTRVYTPYNVATILQEDVLLLGSADLLFYPGYDQHADNIQHIMIGNM